MRLGVGTQGVAPDFDPTSFLVIQKNTLGIDGVLAGQELLRVTPDGNVGIGTSAPVTALHLAGNLTLDAGDSPVLFTGTGNSEENRYLQLINSSAFTSASGLKAGGILIADGYSFANPGKNDLIVKGNVGIGTANPLAKLDVRGDILLPGMHLQQSAFGGGAILLTQRNGIDATRIEQGPGGGGLIRLFGASGTQIGNETVDLGQNTANGGSIRFFGPNGNETVLISATIGFPDNGFIRVTDAQGIHTAIMAVDASGRSVVEADVKNFRVAHPTQPNTDIVYACIEGPEAAVYVRGTGQLVNGEASIPLPDHFVSVANPETMTVQVTPLSADSLGLSVVAKGPSDFVVKELHRGAGSYDFDWEVKCVRKGHEGYAVTRPRSEMASIGGLAPQAAMEMRASLTSSPEGPGRSEIGRDAVD